MFNQKPTTAKFQKKTLPIREAAVTILTSGCQFSGKLYCRGSSRIGGKIEGEIVSEGLLIIEEGAYITAEIVADEAVIQGTVKGKIRAKGRVELCSTCHFDGDISTPSLIINEGAQFNGRSAMIPAEAASREHGKVLDAMPHIESNENGRSRQPDIAL